MTTISKTFDFDAAHRLDRLPADHKCHRLHGHTYRVEIRIRVAELDDQGMVCDYAVLETAWKSIHDQIDHRYLNDIPGLAVPTTEILAHWIWTRLVSSLPERAAMGLERVRVYESSSTWAEVPS